MRIWGYILIILNIGTAGAFIYYATAVLKARTDWQYALLKQQLIRQGLPLMPPAATESVDEDSVPVDFDTGGGHSVIQIRKSRLKKLVPDGGSVLGGEPKTNQSDEVARVEKIVFSKLVDEKALRESQPDSKESAAKRNRLMILLLNLSQGPQREGVFALFRPWPISGADAVKKEATNLGIFSKDEFDSQGQQYRDAANLGRTPKQLLALRALAAVADVNAAIANEGHLSADLIAERKLAARRELGQWMLGEVAPSTPTPGGDAFATNEERDRLDEAVKKLQEEISKTKPNPEQVKTLAEGLNRLAEGEIALKSPQAKQLLPYLIAVGSNPLSNQEDVKAAKAKLVELLQARSATKSENKAMTDLADLMIPNLELPPNTPLDKKAKEEEKYVRGLVVSVGLELLRAYFEEVEAKPTTELVRTHLQEKPPPPDKPLGDPAQIRSFLGGKPVIDPGEQRRKIAHLLYHLDANLGGDPVRRQEWLETFVPSGKDEKKEETKEGEAPKLSDADAALIENRVKWHQRVVAVVGLQAYVATAEAQAADFLTQAETVRKRTMEEQGIFLNEYRQIVFITKELAVQLFQRQQEQADLEALRKTNDDQLKVEVAAKKELEDRLAAATARTKTALAELDAKSKQLFSETKRLGAVQDSLLDLEKQLRELELGKNKK